MAVSESKVSVSRPMQLGTLQALRAIAAIMVVLFHMNAYTLPSVLQSARLWPGVNMGYAGVEIFFVLSGFIMFYVHANDFGRPDRLRSYLWKRVTRIYPFFWIVLIGIVALRLIDGDPLPQAWNLIASAALLPVQEVHIMRVQWTLSFEMFFYLMFSLALVSKRLGLVIGGIWFGTCALAAIFGYNGLGSEFFISAYNLLFLMGTIAAYLWNKLTHGSALILGVGILIFLATGLFEAIGGFSYYKPLRTVLYGLGAMAMVMSLVALEGLGHIRTPKWLVFLGDTSYALYLVHITAMSIAAQILLLLGLSDLPPILLSTLLVAAAIIGGAIAHIALEKPIIAFIRKLSVRVQ